MYKLSIVIPIFNKSSFTLSALNDLFKLNSNHEIICVDNASTDDTEIKLSEIKQSNFKYIRNKENLYHSKGCNIGYAASEGENVLFINNDIRVKEKHSDWTDSIIEACSSSIVGPTMGQLDKDLNFIKESNSYLDGNSYMSGWCVASSKANWNKLDINGRGQIWNEKLPMYFNDGDLTFRARKKKISLKVIDVPVVHFGKVSSSQLNINKLYNEGKKVFCNIWLRK